MAFLSGVRYLLPVGTVTLVQILKAYLYYAINGWVSYSQGVPWSPDDVTPTMDVHYNRYVNTTYDGEGQFVVPGPLDSRFSGWLYVARFPTEICTRGCHRFPRLSTR
jgi:hypothetical protein